MTTSNKVKNAILSGETIERNAWSIHVDNDDHVVIFPPKGAGFKTSLANIDRAVKDFCKKAEMPIPGVKTSHPPKDVSDPDLGKDTTTNSPFTVPKVNTQDDVQGQFSSPTLGLDSSTKKPFNDPSVIKRQPVEELTGGLPDTELGEDSSSGEPNFHDHKVTIQEDGRVSGRRSAQTDPDVEEMYAQLSNDEGAYITAYDILKDNDVDAKNIKNIAADFRDAFGTGESIYFWEDVAREFLSAAQAEGFGERGELLQGKFDELLIEAIDDNLSAALATPGVYAVLLEHYANEIYDAQQEEEDLDEVSILEDLVVDASDLLQVPGTYEILSEEFNNKVLEKWEEESEDTRWEPKTRQGNRKSKSKSHKSSQIQDTFSQEKTPDFYSKLSKQGPSAQLLEDIMDPEKWTANNFAAVAQYYHGGDLDRDMSDPYRQNNNTPALVGYAPEDRQQMSSADKSAVAPPGEKWERMVKDLKNDSSVDNPYAVAWSQYNKSKGARKHQAEAQERKSCGFSIYTNISEDNAEEDGFVIDWDEATQAVLRVESNVLSWLNQNVGYARDEGHSVNADLIGTILVNPDRWEFVMLASEDEHEEPYMTSKGDFPFDPYDGVSDEYARLIDVQLGFFDTSETRKARKHQAEGFNPPKKFPAKPECSELKLEDFAEDADRKAELDITTGYASKEARRRVARWKRFAQGWNLNITPDQAAVGALMDMGYDAAMASALVSAYASGQELDPESAQAVEKAMQSSQAPMGMVARIKYATLSDADKKVLAAFSEHQAAEGKWLYTDGESLEKLGLGGETVARWVGDYVYVTSTESVKSDESILRGLKKVIPSNWLKFSYGDNAYSEEELLGNTDGPLSSEDAPVETADPALRGARKIKAGPKLKEKWDEAGGYNRDMEAESAEELYHLVRSFGSEDPYDWSSYKPQMPAAPSGDPGEGNAAGEKFEGDDGLGGAQARRKVRKLRAVDDKAKDYWKGYFGEYGEELTEAKPKSRQKTKKDEKRDAIRNRVKANISKRARQRLAQESMNPANQPGAQNALQGAPVADVGPAAPAQAGTPAPKAPAPAKPAGGASKGGEIPPGSGDSGLQALGWTMEEIQVMTPEEKQKILQIKLNKPGTKPKAPASPAPAQGAPAKPAPKAPASPAPAPVPASPAPVEARIMAKRLENKLKIRLAQMDLEAPPMQAPQPTSPVPGATETPSKATTPTSDSVDMSQMGSSEEKAFQILQEVRQQEVNATDSVGVAIIKNKLLAQRLMTEVGMTLDEAKKLFGIQNTLKLFQ